MSRAGRDVNVNPSLQEVAYTPAGRDMGGSFKETEKTEALIHPTRSSQNLLSARCRDGGEIRQNPVLRCFLRSVLRQVLLTAYQQGLQETKTKEQLLYSKA